MTKQAGQRRRPLPVLFLVPNLITGGAERQLATLVTRMDRRRFLPIVVCQKAGGPFCQPIVEAGVPVHCLELHRKVDLRFPWRLGSLCRRYNVQALVMRGFSTGVIGRLLGKAMGIHPLIMAEHSTGRIDPDPKKRPIERLLASWTDGIIAVAKGQLAFLVQDMGYDEHRIRVIYNGIDLDQWNPSPRHPGVVAEFSIPQEAPVVGILAMLRPEKDHQTFLAAAKIVHDKLPRTHFLIVGDGPDRSRLERLASHHHLDDVVHFAGERGDVPHLLTVFDASVLCSVTVETFPMSFLESMAMECPLVATNLGGLPEMIEEGENGFLVPLRDPDALAAAILEIVSNRGTIRAMGLRSRQIVEERFTVERMVRDTEDYLDSFFS